MISVIIKVLVGVISLEQPYLWLILILIIPDTCMTTKTLFVNSYKFIIDSEKGPTLSFEVTEIGIFCD